MAKAERKISSLPVYKTPPQSEELERTVLGTCIVVRDGFEIAIEEIKIPKVFYFEKHQHIYATMRDMHTARKQIDIATLAEELKVRNLLEQVGGRHYLTVLTTDVVGAAHLQQHCRKIKEHYIAREVMLISHEAISRLASGEDCFEVANDQVKRTEEVINMGNDVADPSFSEGIFTFIKEFSEGLNHSDELTGIPSGFFKLDQLTNGWQDSDLVILAARPSVGKTAFALNLALNAAMHKTKPSPVGFFSMEMSKRKLIERMASTITEVNADDIRKRKVSEPIWNAIVAKLTNESETPIYIDDTPALNWLELRQRAKRMKRNYHIKLFIVDYLQLMHDVQDGEKRNKEQQVARITGELKKLAKELNVPVIALSQLSRELERRGDANKTPQLSDLRDSGAIEQDADIVMFIYRPEYHGIDTNEHGHSTLGETDIKVAKHRNGMLDTIKFVAHLSIQKFEEITSFPTEDVRVESEKKFSMWRPVRKDTDD